MKRLALAPLILIAAGCTSETVSGDNTVWHPSPGATWQWQLTGTIDESYDVDMYDVDLFDTPADTIRRLRARGRVVVCYFSAGSMEDWRPDAASFPEEAIGEPLEGWPGERWLDVREIDAIGPVLSARLDLAVEKGCDGVEPDNVDAHLNESGFEITSADQLVFNRWLANQAHERGLSIGLKNDLPQAAELVADFDWMLVEECVEFEECAAVEPFVEAGKAVFGAEYRPTTDEACAEAQESGVSLISKDLDLGPEVEFCD